MSSNYHVLYYSENDGNSRNFLRELHKTTYFSKFIKLCVDKSDIKVPRCIRSIPTIIVPTSQGPKLLSGDMLQKWMDDAKKTTIPGNNEAGGNNGAGGSNNGAGGNMEQFDNKVAHMLKPFGKNDNLTASDSAGTTGYSSTFSVWNSNQTGSDGQLYGDDGTGLNSFYTPIGLDNSHGKSGGQKQPQQQQQNMANGGVGLTGIDTRQSNDISKDYETLMAMRDSDPTIRKPTMRS